MVRLPDSIIKKLNPETIVHISLIQWIQAAHPLIFPYVIHIPNERKTSKFMGYILKLMGVCKGASDLFIAYPRGTHHGLFLELKTEKGRPTKHQIDFLSRMKEVGYAAQFAYGIDDAMESITNYLSLGDFR